ncbi:RICIN domain-containing protein [Streptomyces sp. HUAS TT20]|uniref:RICIN domain-containing protein n=1 Tax=Streptomyces sp. HUAS TT20 TaxID=3447509 RepID=UPI0021DA9FD1|nr:RICIN domain-containing protein [Streptomyces sp. HUAS 15-9]UXY32045.1 RICIN domain-containing protein [Streptomyces sp. HUAS 15-9]
MTRTTWPRRLASLAAVGTLTAGGMLVHSSTFAADCGQFPGGICPPFTDTQKLPEFGDRWWNIKSARADDLVVEEDGGGFRVQPRRDRGSQLFRFLKSSDANDEHGSIYQIQVMPKVPPPDPGTPMCLEGSDGYGNRAGVSTNPCEKIGSQYWEIEPHPNGFFRIRRGTGAGRCLDADNPAMTAPPPRARLQEWACHGMDNQAWTFVSPLSQPLPSDQRQRERILRGDRGVLRR